MRLSNLVAKIEDATLRGAAKAKSFAAEFKADLAEARARRMAKQIEDQAAIAARAFQIIAERDNPMEKLVNSLVKE